MPKDPLKYSMGLEPDYGVLGDLTGSLMETAGNIPWLQALGQTAGQALDWADVSGPEYMEAPWYQRAAAGAIDPGGTIFETGGMAAGVTDPETLLKMKMMGGLVPDATPGPVSPAVGAAIRGGDQPLRQTIAQMTKEGRQYPGLRKGMRKTAEPGHILSEELPKGLKEVGGFETRGSYIAPAPAKGDLAFAKKTRPGRIAVKRGGPDIAGTAAHEAVGHRTWIGLTPMQRQSIRNAINKSGPHPKAKPYKTISQPNESFTFGVQQILRGEDFTGPLELERAIREIIGESGQAPGLLSDFAASQNIPLMQAEIDPLLKVMSQ